MCFSNQLHCFANHPARLCCQVPREKERRHVGGCPLGRAKLRQAARATQPVQRWYCDRSQLFVTPRMAATGSIMRQARSTSYRFRERTPSPAETVMSSVSFLTEDAHCCSMRCGDMLHRLHMLYGEIKSLLVDPLITINGVCVLFSVICDQTHHVGHRWMFVEIAGTGTEHCSTRSAYFDAGRVPEHATPGERLFISDRDVAIIHLSGDEARWPGRTDSGQFPWSRWCPEDDRTMRIHPNDPRRGADCTEEAANACQGAPSRDGKKERIDVSLHLRIDFGQYVDNG